MQSNHDKKVLTSRQHKKKMVNYDIFFKHYSIIVLFFFSAIILFVVFVQTIFFYS